jgi:spermidine/putrescine transport system permease protein
MKKFIAQSYLWLLLTLLYAPIIIIAIFSFTEAKVLGNWTGFSTKLYTSLFQSGAHHSLVNAIENTLIIALVSAAVSTVLGSIAAIGIDRLRGRKRAVINSLNNIPMLNPDIITGISLMLMFVFVGRLFGASTSLNFWTMLIAHVTFCLPYVILQVLPKLQQMDKSLPEAAMDLGCTPLKAFFKVELPEIMPGIVTGAIMAFTLSLDDFVISLFNGGDVFKTLPVLIYSYTKKPVKPDIYALFTILVVVILLLLVLSNVVSRKGERKEKRAK